MFPRHPVVRRRGIVGTAAARAGRHAAGRDDHGGHPLDAEQAEQARDRWRPRPPRRRSGSPMRLTVARNPPSPTPRSTSGAPIFAASRAHCRQLAAGTDRLVNSRISGVLPRSARPSARRACLPFGRKRRGGRSGQSRNRLPCGGAGTAQGALDHRARPCPQGPHRRFRPPCAAPPPRDCARSLPAAVGFHGAKIAAPMPDGSTRRDRARRPGQGRFGKGKSGSFQGSHNKQQLRLRHSR